MALLDVSAVLSDPLFTDQAELIRRTYSINEYGEMELVETSQTITAVIQTGDPEMLARLPEGAKFSDSITVYYRGVLQAAGPNNQYADVIRWRDRRYVVKMVGENYINFGSGYMSAICLHESANV